MAATCPGGFISTERAALALDRAARTDEAFVSALTAEDAPVALRELSAQWALTRCAGTQVARVLPFAAPRGAPRAVLGGALLAAALLVPAGSGARATDRGVERVPVPADGGASAGAADSPSDRVRALVAALGASAHQTQALTPSVRQDIPALTADELAQLAQALADADLGARSEAAGRALAALAAGDPERAAAELRAALAADGPRAAGSDPSGAATSPVSDQGAQAGDWRAASWPLRYDRTVRRWFELGRAAHGSGPGGGR
jgi:hypothetical protein